MRKRIGLRICRQVALHQRDALVTVCSVITQLNTRRLTPKRVGRQHHKAVQRVLLGHRADVVVDAEFQYVRPLRY